MTGVTSLFSPLCRFGAGVEKKVDALRFCCGCDEADCCGCRDGDDPFCCSGESPSTTKLTHPESMWLLISADLTGLLQMGQSTAIAVACSGVLFGSPCLTLPYLGVGGDSVAGDFGVGNISDVGVGTRLSLSGVADATRRHRTRIGMWGAFGKGPPLIYKNTFITILKARVRGKAVQELR